MKSLLPFAAAALVALSACSGSDQTEEVSSRAPDPMASQLANAAPVDLPPPITANATLRCKDNSLIYVDFFQGDTQVNLRPTQTATPIRLTAPAAGGTFEGEGYSVKGTPKSVTYTQPGKPALTCTA